MKARSWHVCSVWHRVGRRCPGWCRCSRCPWCWDVEGVIQPRKKGGRAFSPSPSEEWPDDTLERDKRESEKPVESGEAYEDWVLDEMERGNLPREAPSEDFPNFWYGVARGKNIDRREREAFWPRALAYGGAVAHVTGVDGLKWLEEKAASGLHMAPGRVGRLGVFEWARALVREIGEELGGPYTGDERIERPEEVRKKKRRDEWSGRQSFGEWYYWGVTWSDGSRTSGPSRGSEWIDPRSLPPGVVWWEGPGRPPPYDWERQELVDYADWWQENLPKEKPPWDAEYEEGGIPATQEEIDSGEKPAGGHYAFPKTG